MTPYGLDDAERDLRTALTSGDPEAIAAASNKVDQLDLPATAVSLLSAALWYAEHRIPVFPLSPGSKIPFKGSAGCKDATTDLERVTAWWTEHPDANIGVATGHAFDVVDIDGQAGQISRARLWDSVFGRIEDDAVAKVLTPRPGGMHLYVPATGDGNSAGLCPGVDYRGRGGYVVAPPSRTDQGTYRFLTAPTLDRLADKVA